MWGMAPDGNAKVRPANMAWVSLAGCGECAFAGYKKLPGRACSAPWGVRVLAYGRGRVVVVSGHALPPPSSLAYLPSSDTHRSAHRAQTGLGAGHPILNCPRICRGITSMFARNEREPTSGAVERTQLWGLSGGRMGSGALVPLSPSLWAPVPPGDLVSWDTAVGTFLCSGLHACPPRGPSGSSAPPGSPGVQS